ncbi:hepatocyte nuclear factor 6-like protein [Leptotrombidium deliense]|uniref:Hepatocyte nuclear factor 6-like protein n=1 Tax=Leptotrombidium deliense TaxID=299467 RepID=A0A443SW88_9ACAR|nr:hepatocyte nuclear factor 6-like protein [Leptotrombidium deliense]
MAVLFVFTACKRKEEQQQTQKQPSAPKKPRLVFTDLQRRTLQAIFKETKRPSKEMQITISQQLGLDLSTVGNFFMNARRRSQDKWLDDTSDASKNHSSASNSPSSSCTGGGSASGSKITGQPTSVVTLGVVTSTTSSCT